MNELHDDPHLRLLELNRINALLDKSLDYAWELSHGGNREKHEITIDKDKDKDMYVNRYTDIINDKLDLVNEIGELIDSHMSDAYNIVDGINKSHNNSSAYDILAEDLKKCKDTILKMIIVQMCALNKILRKMTPIMSMYVINKIIMTRLILIIIMINQILK